jgi:hypothetical protein
MFLGACSIVFDWFDAQAVNALMSNIIETRLS